jgi:AcrR family transcriptional regulator
MRHSSAASSAVQSEPASARERSRAETRRRLTEAGAELFARQGLHPTTTVQIARAAGVAAGTFYLHFPDKHALYREIAVSAFATLRERLSAASARAGPEPLAVVRARANEVLRFAEDQRSLVRVLFGRDREAAGPNQDLFDDTIFGIETGLRRRIARGEAAALDPAVAAQALAAMWERVVTWWVEDPSRAPREAVVETLVALHPFAAAQRASDGS